jgi:hypothetical protein
MSRASSPVTSPLRRLHGERPTERLEPVMGERDVPVRVCADGVRTLAADYRCRQARCAPEVNRW